MYRWAVDGKIPAVRMGETLIRFPRDNIGFHHYVINVAHGA